MDKREPVSELLRIEVPCDRDAPAVVRRALEGLVEIGWHLGDAMLVASELVTNAIVHSGCSEEHAITVHVSLGAEHLLISVHDPGISGQDAQVRERPSIGGWGLQIVGQLAQRWGSERPDGYRIWAQVALPS